MRRAVCAVRELTVARPWRLALESRDPVPVPRDAVADGRATPTDQSALWPGLVLHLLTLPYLCLQQNNNRRPLVRPRVARRARSAADLVTSGGICRAKAGARAR